MLRRVAAYAVLLVLWSCVARPEAPEQVAERTAAFSWQYSGLAQLGDARSAAADRDSKVLVGLSGSLG